MWPPFDSCLDRVPCPVQSTVCWHSIFPFVQCFCERVKVHTRRWGHHFLAFCVHQRRKLGVAVSGSWRSGMSSPWDCCRTPLQLAVTCHFIERGAGTCGRFPLSTVCNLRLLSLHGGLVHAILGRDARGGTCGSRTRVGTTCCTLPLLIFCGLLKMENRLLQLNRKAGLLT